jgi:hypothetical protein
MLALMQTRMIPVVQVVKSVPLLLTLGTMPTSEVFLGESKTGEKRLQDMMQRVLKNSQNPLYFSLSVLARLLD